MSFVQHCHFKTLSLRQLTLFKFRMLTITSKPSLPHAGAGLVPAHKQCSTYFKKKLGHYLRAGTRPAPAKRQ